MIKKMMNDEGCNYQLLNNIDINLFWKELNDNALVDKPDFTINSKFAEQVYVKNKNLCSGYFCSFIPLTFKNNMINIPLYDSYYKKQISNEFSKYNKCYTNKLNSRCSDIVGKHFNKPRTTKIFLGSNLRTQTTQGCKKLTNKYQNI